FLNRLQNLDTPVKSVIIGMGAMGKGLYHQANITPGIECLAIADLDIERCVNAAKIADREYKNVTTAEELASTINDGTLAITSNGMLLADYNEVDVLIEATSAIEEGAKYVIKALNNSVNVILMNAEIDLAFGAYFMQVAKENDVVCTSIDGDQYGVIKRLMDEIELWGFELVMAGNIKGFMDLSSNPTKIIPEADKRNLDYKMCVSYTDGTKMCIEMAINANQYGMRTHIPGMHGPKTSHVSEVLDVFNFDKIWKEKGKVPLVDYVLGSEPGGGIFVVGYNDHPYQKNMMSYYKMGNGPYYVFYRPMHLCHVEAMRTTIEAVLDKKVLLMPEKGFQTNVFAYAKTDLKANTTLDGLGGYSCYGLIENCDPKVEPTGLPILLAEDIVLKRDIMKDEKINLEDVEYNSKDYKFD
ncbi:MAG: homoserine dehydrogenase, partial [Candidatus Heimdallarchaeota archaeon]